MGQALRKSGGGGVPPVIRHERILTPSLVASIATGSSGSFANGEAAGDAPASVVSIDGTRAKEMLIPNPRWTDGKPVLSVLVPYYKTDPSPLLFLLDREAVEAEVILLDNGTGDKEMLADIVTTATAMDLPTLIVRLDRYEGNSRARNRLARHARAQNFLFVDADMLPDMPNYLATYINLIASRNPAVVFGGYSVLQAPNSPEFDLHRKLAQSSDCAPAAIRRLMPEKHIFTSNLLVRRDVFDEENFDESFRGWGWEDIEWSMRVGRKYPLTHIDNSCTHLGLNSAKMLAAKFEQSAANFGRMVARHRDRMANYRSYRAARLLKKIPMRRVWKPLLKTTALMESIPLGLRAMAMRLYRAVLYVDAV